MDVEPIVPHHHERVAADFGERAVRECDSLGALQVHRRRREYRPVPSPRSLAVGETVILLHPPLSSAGVSIGTERECQ